MSGRYENAPLVYVSTIIKTTALPRLTENQQAELEQLMIKAGLPDRRKGSGTSLSFNLSVSEGNEPQAESKVVPHDRIAFFNVDSSECLLLDTDFIEFRTSSYSDYEALCQRMNDIFTAMFESISIYQDVISSEIQMNYVDVIVPLEGRCVSDYFSNSSALPLNFIESDPTAKQQKIGSLTVSRLVTSSQKVNFSLEQLPMIDGKVPKFVPNSLMEPDPNFGMPLSSLQASPSATDYALLLTQSMKIMSKKLGEVNVYDDFDSLHMMTKDTFTTIINEEVCNQDWNYKEGN